MDPIGAIGGSLIGGFLGYEGQKEANQTNRDIANTNNAWSNTMSSSSIQRSVADMKAAGINPILGFNGAGGAPPVSASQVQVQNEMQQPAQSAGSAVSSAMQALSLKKDIEQKDSNVDLQGAQKRAADASAASNLANARATLLSVPKLKSEGQMYDQLSKGITNVTSLIKGFTDSSAKSSYDDAASAVGDVMYGGKGGKWTPPNPNRHRVGPGPDVGGLYGP